ncbi:MAG: cobalt-precorrin-6A reductase, partial [Rhodobacterales bacterium]|nr:cobalt-precorrin-6A reductase [Rhodobacterales bacterium]
FSKILAARNLNIPVVLLNRPKLPLTTNSAENVEEAMKWLNNII